MNEEFAGSDGKVHTLLDFPRTTTSKYIRAYACARYGQEYVQSHIFGEYSGASKRQMATKEVIDELRRVLFKVFRVSRDQATAAWTSVKDSLNRMGPEEAHRKRKADS
uniref:Transposase n=1 Tax=Macrostomum lignano TaxID=282301 RepID=A0A1I8GTI9_9PLAT